MTREGSIPSASTNNTFLKGILIKFQNLFEATGDVWVIVLDLSGGQFNDDDIFENMEIFGSEQACVARIFEHLEDVLTVKKKRIT